MLFMVLNNNFVYAPIHLYGTMIFKEYHDPMIFLLAYLYIFLSLKCELAKTSKKGLLPSRPEN